jgi:predicted type IV restriction endonuclease
MEDIKIVINRSKELLTEFTSYYDSNEQEVCDDIIKPILIELGWKSHPEFTIPKKPNDEGKIPDYTLIKNQKKMLILEAKKMSIPVINDKDSLKQIAEYCYSQSVEYGVLTNGKNWLLYETFQKDKKQRRERWIDLLNDNIDKCISFFSILKYDSIESLENETKKNKMLENIWKEINNSQTDLIKAFTEATKIKISDLSDSPINIDSLDIENFVTIKIQESKNRLNIAKKSNPISRPIQTSSNSTITKENNEIREMKIGNNIYPIGKRELYNILVNTAEWLIKEGKLKREDVPINTKGEKNYEDNKINYLVNKDHKNSGNKEFRAPKPLSNGLYIETSFGKSQIIVNARKLLKSYDYQEELLEIID